MFDWPYSRMWKHSLLFRNTKDAEGSCAHWRSLECRLRESGLALSFPPIRKYSEEFLLCSRKSFHAECFVSLVQVHFICEKTTFSFSLLFQKLAASLEKCPHHFVLFQAFCLRGQNAWNIFHLFHNWNSIQVNQTYTPSFVFLLQNKVSWTNPGARVKLGTLDVTNLLFMSGCLLLRWNITEALLFTVSLEVTLLWRPHQRWLDAKSDLDRK